MRIICFLFMSGLLQACMTPPKTTTAEIFAIEHPSALVQSKVDYFLPKTIAWIEEVEYEIYPYSRPLNQQEIKEAFMLGVKDPGVVRIIERPEFPMPQDAQLLSEAKKHGFGSRDEWGRCMGYLILLKSEHARNPELIRHELVHVAQQDRMGRQVFLRRYLTELGTVGYARSPLELEAYSKQSGNN